MARSRLRAISDGGTENLTLATDILAHVESKKYTDVFASYVRTAGEAAARQPPQPNKWRAIYYNDSWHSLAFKAAVPKLRELIFETRLKIFKASPSITLYDQLLALAPSLLPELDNLARNALFPTASPGACIHPDKHSQHIYPLVVQIVTK